MNGDDSGQRENDDESDGLAHSEVDDDVVHDHVVNGGADDDSIQDHEEENVHDDDSDEVGGDAQSDTCMDDDGVEVVFHRNTLNIQDDDDDGSAEDTLHDDDLLVLVDNGVMVCNDDLETREVEMESS